MKKTTTMSLWTDEFSSFTWFYDPVKSELSGKAIDLYRHLHTYER